MTIRTEVDVLAAAAALVARGPEVVIITSAELQDSPGERRAANLTSVSWYPC